MQICHKLYNKKLKKIMLQSFIKKYIITHTMANINCNFILENRKKTNVKISYKFRITDFDENSILSCPCVREVDDLNRFDQVVYKFSNLYSKNC
jgi:hypothetical protein